jgi:hypothetical protein
LLAFELYLGLEACSFTIVRLERASETIICSSVEIPTTFLRAEHGVAQCLRRLVSELSRPKGLESRLSIIERILRGSSCAIELLLQPVE